jgi:hypothetical protein
MDRVYGTGKSFQHENIHDLRAEIVCRVRDAEYGDTFRIKSFPDSL